MPLDEAARAATKKFMEEVASRMAPEKRGAFLAAQEDAAAFDALAEGVLRQQEFSRVLKANQDWRAAQEAHLSEYAKIKPEFEKLKAQVAGAPPTPTPGTPPSTPPAFDPASLAGKFVTPEAHAQAMGILAERLAGLTVTSQKLGWDHFARFGKPLDMDTFWKTVAERQAPPEQVYAEITAPLQKELDEKAFNERVEQETAKRLAERAGTRTPHPGEFFEPGPVMDFTKDPDKEAVGVAAAVADWMQQRQASAGSA